MSHHRDPHVDDGALLALLDGELSAEERRRVENHATGCAVCAARRDELRFAVRRVTSALEVMDVPAAWVEMPEALREAARSAPVPLASARAARSGWRIGWRIGWMGRRSVAVAAGLTLLLAAGAYAVPGSPVRGWVDGGGRSPRGVDRERTRGTGPGRAEPGVGRAGRRVGAGHGRRRA